MQIRKLTFQYEKNGRKIFDDFNWTLDPEQVHFIIGGNGVGKTTFYELISGLLPFKTGEIDSQIDSKDILLQLQNVPMLKTMSGADLADLILGADGQFGSISLQSVSSRLPSSSQDKLAHLWATDYGQMSVGERRWLLIYYFSLLDRELYIFDEPTAGLDLQSAQEILRMIEKLSSERGKKVLLTTHQLSEMDSFENYTVSFFHDGKNYFTGSKKEFLKIKEGNSDNYIHLKNFLTTARKETN